MGYATTVFGCGCITSTIMESGKVVQYERCAEHYIAEEDDVKIVEAMKNKKEHERQLWKQANDFFHRKVGK